MRRAAFLALAILLWSGAAAYGATPFTARNVQASRVQTSWSPDGRWIASVPETDPNLCCQAPHLTLFSPDGSGQRDLGFPAGPGVWSQDGRQIAWLATKLLTVLDVSTGPPRLTNLAVKDDYWDWSPNGEQFAYVTPDGALRVAGTDGSGVHELAPSAADPQWSPDGREIAFSVGEASCATTSSSVDLIDADGTNLRVLSRAGEIRVQPAWSPQGDRIAFAASGGCNIFPSRVYVARRDGTGERVVHEVPWDIPGRTTWSPAGQWVTGSYFNSIFALIEVDGPGRVPPRGSGFSWAPTGDKVVYSAGAYGKSSVKVLSVDGSERWIAAGHGADWSPDGRRISYLGPAYETSIFSFGHCQKQLFVVDSDGSGKRALSPCWQNGNNWPQVRDVIVGTQARDTAHAYSGPDLVSGLGGDDTLYGGDGRDRIYGGHGSDVIYGGRGDDRIGVRDGELDHVSCGKGRDVVSADSLDVVAGDCELVRRA